jgi:hypothetical protein
MARIQLDTKQLTENRIPPLRLAFALTVLFGCFALLPIVRANARLEWSILGAAVALLLFQFLLRQQVARSRRRLQYEFLARPVHYVQLVMHMSIYAYWGWYWREVYHQFPLIICQIAFTYVLDMLVCWSRRDNWVLGFGPFPIVLSTNLFLWFKPDWYFLQFLMLATIVLCKEFITWKRDGRRAHIFNPSAVALFIFSVGLILTQSTNITWGQEIAVSQSRPPYIYLEIFLLGLVVQSLFSVTLVTLSSVATVYAMNLIYTHVTGVYYFTDANIPAAVFLGMHLLVTDPATSPRKNFGKIVFGSLYGVGVFGFVWLLDSIGVPPFYDKLLCVPLLNLTVRALDRASVALDTRLRLPTWEPRRANLTFMAVWICLFAVMYRTGFLGSYHPGANPEFWREACVDGRPTGCQTWIRQMKVFCSHGSGTACMALGVELDGGQMVRPTRQRRAKTLRTPASWACPMVVPGCFDLLGQTKDSLFSAPVTQVMAKAASFWVRCTSPAKEFPKTQTAPSRCYSNLALRVGPGGAVAWASVIAPERGQLSIMIWRSRILTRPANAVLRRVVSPHTQCIAVFTIQRRQRKGKPDAPLPVSSGRWRSSDTAPDHLCAPGAACDAAVLPSRVAFSRLTTRSLSARTPRTRSRRARVHAPRMRGFPPDGANSVVRCSTKIVRRNIRISVHVYGKQYASEPTFSCIVCIYLISVGLFLVLRGNKRAMNRPTKSLRVWGQGWGYKDLRHFRHNL